jgi:hypothetical protein
MITRTWTLLCAVLVLLGAPAGAAPPERNGFELAPASVDAAEILSGGPPRDGIPALDHPPHLTAAEAPRPGPSPAPDRRRGSRARR